MKTNKIVYMIDIYMAVLVHSLNRMIIISVYSSFLIFILNSERKARDFGLGDMFHNSFKGLFQQFFVSKFIMFYSVSQFVICSLPKNDRGLFLSNQEYALITSHTVTYGMPSTLYLWCQFVCNHWETFTKPKHLFGYKRCGCMIVETRKSWKSSIDTPNSSHFHVRQIAKNSLHDWHMVQVIHNYV